jgi:diguanylate cyclase (GGDEF)-like protein
MTSFSADDRAQVLQDASVQFWKHFIGIVWLAFAIHIVLFGLFVALSIPVLWVANALSIVTYVVCLMAIRYHRFQLAGTLFSLEVIAHAIVATWMLGWDSNFDLYLFCLVPIIAFSFQTAPVRRVLLSGAIVLVAVGGFALRRHMGVAQSVGEGWIDSFGMVNALTATGLLMFATALSVRFTLSMQLHLYQSAHRDSLTSLYTRRRVLQRLRQMGGEGQRGGTALILLDVDHFKLINDRHGHDLGDIVLQQVADSIAGCVRGTDIAARWGGEEFLVLMPTTSLAEAGAVAERVLEHIRSRAGLIEGRALVVTATLSVTVIGAEETFRDALKRADGLLYAGKEAGRNRVMLATA